MIIKFTHNLLFVLLLLCFPILVFSNHNSDLEKESFSTLETTLSLFLNPNDPGCSACSDGSISTSVVGGILPYNYIWSNGETTSNIQNLPNGEYSVTVTDILGCQASDSIFIEGVGALTLNVNVLTLGVTCFGENTGNAVAQVNGGTQPYSYEWSTGDSISTSSNLPQGIYSLTVTDADQTMITQEFEITSPDSLTVEVIATVGCEGGNSGIAQANVSGGSFPYSYAWSTVDSTSAIDSLSTGTYGVTITDANGCVASNFAILNQPISVNSNPFPISTSCPDSEDGGITLDAWGGLTPYTFAWSNDSTTQNLSNVEQGIYTVTVTDANGCSNTSEAAVEGPSPITINPQGISTVTCRGGSDGAVLADAFGGTPGYTYVWSNGDVGSFVDSLPAGTHTVTITDANNCIGIGNITVLEPEPFLSFLFGSSVCNGSNDGTVNSTISGGVLPYEYLWSTGATTPNLENLSAGTYYLTVTDINQCTVTDSITVNLSSTILVSNPASSMVTCPNGNDGMASLSPTGGVAPYTYNWNDGNTDSVRTNLIAGTYTVEVFDLFNCSFTESFEITEPAPLQVNATVQQVNCENLNGAIQIAPSGGTAPYTLEWFDGSTGDTLTNLDIGAYAVNVTDANNCVQQFAIEVTAGNNAPSALTQDIVISLDNMGMATISAEQIDNGSSDDCGIDTIFLDITDFDCSSLGENTVTLTVVDDENEMNTATAIVTILDETAPEVLTQDLTIYVDSFGMVVFEMSQIDNGSSDNCGIDTMFLSDVQLDCTTLGENTVTLNVVDLSGNTQTGTAIITVVDTIAANFICIENTLISSCDSTVTADYAIPSVMDNCLTGAPVLMSGPASGESISTGTTTVTYQYTELNGNVIECSFDITLETSPAIDIQLDNITQATEGNNDGSVEITVSSGVAPYTYEWSVDGDSISVEEDPSSLPAGVYQVIVTDANGCVASMTFEVTTGVQDPELVKNVDVYPNPTSDILFVKMDLPIELGNQIQVYSLDGKLLLQKQLQSGESMVEMNMGDFASGVYILQLTVNQGVVSKRVVVRE